MCSTRKLQTINKMETFQHSMYFHKEQTLLGQMLPTYLSDCVTVLVGKLVGKMVGKPIPKTMATVTSIPIIAFTSQLPSSNLHTERLLRIHDFLRKIFRNWCCQLQRSLPLPDPQFARTYIDAPIQRIR